MQQIGFFIVKLFVRSTCFGHHHQELKSYTDGCCLWYLVLWFTRRWSGVELWVVCPVCGMLLRDPNYTQSGIPLQIEHTYTHHMLCCRITTITFYIFNKF